MIENYHAFHVTFKGPTNFKPSKVKILSLRFTGQYILISLGEGRHWLFDAIKHLQNMGFDMVGQAEYSGHGFILFSNTFKPLKDV